MNTKRLQKYPKQDDFPELSDEEKAVYTHATLQILEYFMTPEGEKLGKKIAQISKQTEERERGKEKRLTPNEKIALLYIRNRLAEGTFPSVRDVAKAVGLKSSRSGARIIKRLESKDVLKWYRLNSKGVEND